MAYFEPLDAHTYRPTEHATGAWNVEEQHVGPSLGLLTHLVLADQATRRPQAPLVAARLCFDLWGVAPLQPLTTSVEVVRPGRTIELVEARTQCAGRTIATLRAWMLQPQDSSKVAGTHAPTIPGPDAMARFDPTTVWPGGYIASAQVRREQVAPGRAHVWVRPGEELLAGQEVAPLARFASMFDVINGMTVRADPSVVAFPNVDLTAHLTRTPEGEWLGFDTTVTFGAGGLGLTHSELHDEAGPLGTISQVLTVRVGGA